MLFAPALVQADEITLVAPGGIRAAVEQLIPGFERATGHKVKATFGSGLGTKKQVADGAPFDVPIVQPPYPEVLASGHVVANSAAPLARVAVGVAVRTGQRKPDISTPDAVKRLLLSVKSFSYPDPAGGAAAGVSFTKTLQDLGITEQVKSKIHLARGGAAAMAALAKGEVEIGLTFYSEILTEPGVEAVGMLPESISPRTSLVAFVSTHARNSDAACALVRHLSSADAAATYLKVGMEPPDIVGVGNFAHIVVNMDKSLEFYRDVLGLEVVVNQPFSPNPAIMKLGNTPGAQSRFLALKVPGSDLGIELIEYKDIDRKPQHPKFVDPGAANMALRVRDINSVFEKLQKFGATILTRGGKPVSIGNGGGAYLFVQDPDGFVVELSQGTPPADSKVPATTNVFGGAFETTVADSAASVKFYEMLGLPMQLGASFNDNQLMAETAGAPGASFRQSGATIPGTSARLTLIEFKNIARTPLKGRVQDPGTAILQLTVRDVTALTAKLKAAGVPVVTAGGVPVDLGNNLKIAIMRSPDNLFLELVQRSAPPPASARLYVLDCGMLDIDPAGVARYHVTEKEVVESRMPVPCFLVAHPKGTLLWDAGVIPDADVEKAAPKPALYDVNPVSHAVVSRTLKSQLAAIGYAPSDITYVAVSHAHKDHTANLNQFASSTWLTRPIEREFMFKPNNERVEPKFYGQLEHGKTVMLDKDEFDVFGDGVVTIKAAPGHTPGHQVLVLNLAKTGRVMVAGDLYHYPPERTFQRTPPDNEFNVEQSAASRAMIEEYLKKTKTAIWIEHDYRANAKLKKSPAFYE